MALTAAQITTAFQNALQRAPTAGDVDAFVSASQTGFFTDAQVFDTISNSAEANTYVDPVVRFYQAAFGRVPDQAGLHFQVSALETPGQTLKSIAEGFAHSPEF